MLERTRYEKILKEQMRKPEIKILTGMYRSGKSTLLKNVQKQLRHDGIRYGNILYIDLGAAQHSQIRNGGSLLFVVRNLAASAENRRIYLLFDEIGNLPDWEKAILTIKEQYSCDIYLAGTSTSIFKPGTRELLAGQYVEIPVFPYTFAEYRKSAEESEAWRLLDESEEAYFHDFMIYGNVPGTHKICHEQDMVFSYLLDICQAGILQNVVRPRKLRDIDQIWMVLACVAENLGRPLSAKVIAQELKEEGQPIGKDTVYTILKALTEAQILQKVSRYDRKSGRILEAQEKYYFTDWGMYHSIHGMYSGKLKSLLENIVCMELLGNGWQVQRIADGRTAVDFRAVRGTEVCFIQVLENPEETEIKKAADQLAQIRDSGEKIILVQGLDTDQTETGGSSVYLIQNGLHRFQ